MPENGFKFIAYGCHRVQTPSTNWCRNGKYAPNAQPQDRMPPPSTVFRMTDGLRAKHPLAADVVGPASMLLGV
ncbi:nitrogenase iron protein [Anopheles sinensis]|uniref:Nitrogenase iron protein n=1 Tax=Anopheles sinensis TaxID=74873 RepID=A0A084VX14_ANOSI|nr:nitrogenase iron protein [Anopheles sinensis]